MAVTGIPTMATRENRPYEDFLLSLLELEVAQREENTQKRLIAQARFPYLRTLDQFDFSGQAVVYTVKLSLSDLRWPWLHIVAGRELRLGWTATQEGAEISSSAAPTGGEFARATLQRLFV